MRFTKPFRQVVIVSLVAIVFAGAASRAFADLVKDISTGIDPLTRAKVPNGQTQSFYTIVPGGTGGQAGTWVIAWSEPIYPYNFPSTYVPDDASPGSRWISVYPDGAANPIVGLGTYYYQTTVDLTGFDPATAAIASARFAVDDTFNGVLVNDAAVFTPPPTRSLRHPLTPSLPVSSSPASIRFEGQVTATRVPEPGGVGVVGMAVAGRLLRRRRGGE